MQSYVIVCALLSLGAVNLVCTASQQPVSPYSDDRNTTTSAPGGNTTIAPDDDKYPSYVGFIAAGVAVIFFGSVFVPIKKYETGDGLFFQWMFCCGIWLVGIVVQLVRQSTFYPLVTVGGFIWTSGNMCVVPIVKTIGLGLGMCIWNTFNLLGGWASGRFGWFGIIPEIPKHQALNYVGVALAVSSSIIYMFVKNTVTTPPVEMTVQVNGSTESQPLIGEKERHSINSNTSQEESENNHSFFDQLSQVYKKVIGVTLSLASGFMYGINFAPSIHVQDNVAGASQNSLDYIFAQYCGIFLTSTAFFILYAALKRNKPKVYPEVILPGLVSGVMWGIANGCWFVANKALSEPVAFPIVTTIPGAIASLFWGVCIFKEVKGTKNILILLLAVSVTAAGAILAGVSKG